MHALLLLAGLLPAAPVAAPLAPRAFVVIAGINSYADKEIPSRPHPEDDARTLHDLLADSRYLGAGKEQMRLLLGKSATRHALLDSMEWLRDRAGRDDLVLFAFFGQGATLGDDGNRTCYLAADSTVAGRSEDAIRGSDVADIFDRLQSRRVCVILDVPFTGFRTKRMVAAPSKVTGLFCDFGGDDHSDDKLPLPGRLVLAREGRLGPDICAGLRGEADTGEGVVTSAGLAVFLTKRLAAKQPATHVLQGDGPRYPLVVNPVASRKQIEKAPLPRDEADRYAASVLDLFDVVREEHVLEPDMGRLIDLGIRGLFDRLGEPVPKELVRRLGRLKDLDAAERKQLLADARLHLGKRDDLADARDVRWTIREALLPIDRHSACLVSREWIRNWEIPVGVGLQLRKSAATGLLEVVTPLPGSPAHKAGMKAGDVITTITRTMPDEGAQSVSKIDSTRELSLADCAKRLMGKSGSRVRLTIQRPGERGLREIELTRKRVALESIFGTRRNRDGNWDYWLDPQKKIAYLRLLQFGRDTPEEMHGILQRLQKEGAQGLVLDLRFNPAGLFTSVQKTADLFLKEGELASIRANQGKTETLDIESVKDRFVMPLVVLINEETASGAEILAACLQDHHRAVIVGARSQGKGFVQNVIPIGGQEMLLTTALFLRPTGTPWVAWQGGEAGVKPDKGFEVLMSRREREELYDHMRTSEYLPPPVSADFKDVQLLKALEHFRK